MQFSDDISIMRRALELARRGAGSVEPNPCVGAVIVDDNQTLLGEGFHEVYGGPHAEVNALRNAGVAAAGGTIFVTLEPCAHHGKTPPCVAAIIAAGLRRVVVAARDPARHGAGSGVETLRDAGIEVEVGLCADEGESLLAPFTMRMTQNRPFVHAKWAMTLDGKLATHTRSSQWISNERSRQVVHEMRRKMDGILVGIGTALADDPLLTARPAGKRTAVRVVLDPNARLPLSSQLVRTQAQGPVLIFVSEQADATRVEQLRNADVEVLRTAPREDGTGLDLLPVLHELARRQVTNLLVEGGSRVLGAFFDESLIDEVHCFIAPKLAGGERSLTPIGGAGLETIPSQPDLVQPSIEILDGDVYIHGRIRR